MNSFERVLLRFKEQVGLQTDKEVAALLGTSATAFGDRKKRGAFPEDKLRALAQQRPDLNIDVGYVLNGVRQEEVRQAVANIPVRLQQLRIERGAKAVAEAMGVTEEALARIEGGAEMPTTQQMMDLATNLPDADVALLFGLPVAEASSLTHEEAVLIFNYRESSAEGKEALRRMAAFSAEFNSRK
ncbi:MAG: helix-turn-helix transcriptional regulator [Zoogloea oleivorans]|uniref:helix-turn-helix transcriptional regulator n=1 Tax=Zoogloea oleivorans TaxID=1552750 RepID=UPI002A35E7D6|nr:helix-turn-helix transcriptional regulator [Zoogloea oleivorans]MDY0035427.1 helix-turn-helix transcriptional regulator [Zoogloea oleivorans]